MRRDDELKANHEKAVADRFIQKYNEEKKTNFVFKQQGKPPAPDFKYEDLTGGKIIGIEVTGVYYDKSDAKGSWQVARGNINKSQSNITVNPTEHLRKSIEDAIAKKCLKFYDFSYPTVLVLDATRPPLHDERDIQEIEEMVGLVTLPEHIPFHEIYFGIELELGQYRIWKLYSLESD